jgi:hypothetical protein
MLYGKNRLPLLSQPRRPTFPSSLDRIRTTREKKTERGTYFVLRTAGIHLVCENLCTSFLGFRFMDVLHEHTLVFENITLRFLVKGVIPVRCHAVR